MNNSATEVFMTMQYIIMGIDGGITIPNDPADVTRPIEKRSSYPAFLRAGNMMDPIATTVAGLDPDKAAKKVHDKVAASASPPGYPETNEFIIATSLAAVAPSVMMTPAKIKKGIDSRTELSRALKSC